MLDFIVVVCCPWHHCFLGLPPGICYLIFHTVKPGYKGIVDKNSLLIRAGFQRCKEENIHTNLVCVSTIGSKYTKVGSEGVFVIRFY